MKKGKSTDYEKVSKLFKLFQKDVKKTIDAIFARIEETSKAIQLLAKKNLRISRRANIISVCVLILTAAFLILGIFQFKVTKTYQNWTIKEMSRKPELSLETRDIEIIDSILAVRFRLNLVNSGSEIAKDVQIRHALYFEEDPSLCIDVSSTAGDDINYFSENNKKVISLKVYKHQEIIYFEQEEGEKYSLKLHYIWQLSNMSPKAYYYSIICSIDSDRGIFVDTINIKNPFYKNDKIQK